MIEDKNRFESSLVDLVLSKPVQGSDIEAVIKFCNLFGSVSHFTENDFATVGQIK